MALKRRKGEKGKRREREGWVGNPKSEIRNTDRAGGPLCPFSLKTF
jgi:hypothetical protein